MERELAETLEALHADAFGWALHCCADDRSMAEEVLQNAYVKVVQGRLWRRGGSSFKTWWFGVIRLTAQEEARRRRYRESLLGKLWLQVAGGGQIPVPSPSREMELSERSAELQAALAQLPGRQAEVLHLVFYQDLALSEAAVIMKISIGSVRQHYERGKARLRELLKSTSVHDT